MAVPDRTTSPAFSHFTGPPKVSVNVRLLALVGEPGELVNDRTAVGLLPTMTP